jgi:DNA-binding response OmpR family regulator
MMVKLVASSIRNDAKQALIVDDDPDICALITAALAGSFEFTVCQTGEAALVVVYGPKRFDLILTDFMLPGICGLDLIKMLRTRRETSSVPIMMMTGHVRGDMEGRAHLAGANALLYKPFALSYLRIVVNRLLEIANARPIPMMKEEHRQLDVLSFFFGRR